MTATLYAVLLVIGQTTTAGNVSADTEPSATEQIRELIDDFHVREEASRRLLHAGPEALLALESAAEDSDAERALRARWILSSVSFAADFRTLQGTWTYVSLKDSGKDDEKGVGATLEINGHMLMMRRPDGSKEPGPYAFKINTETSPKQFDMLVGRTFIEGIYRLDGDVLALSYPMGSTGPRPTDFESKVGDQRRVQILKRKTEH